jgi:rsbT co-antagonist protein RsbR
MTVQHRSLEQYQQENSELLERIAFLEAQNQTLEESLRSTTIFFERSTELLSIISFDGLFKVISPAWTSLLGYEEADILNKPFVNFLHPDDVEATALVVERMIQGHPLQGHENRYRAKDGSYRTLSWNGTSDPETRSYYFFSSDITEQKEAERVRDLYIKTIQQLPYAVSIYEYIDLDDFNTLILRGHNSLAKALLPHHDEIIGHSIVELYPTFLDDMEHANSFAEVIRSQKGYSVEKPYDDGKLGGVFNVTLFPLPNQHIAVMYEEISERKRNEEALRQAMLQEEIIAAQKATLDELSTPLIPITDNILVMPLIGTIDSRRAQQVMEAILQGMSNTGSEFLIIDITGVSLIDTQVANTFIQAAQATRLLGAQVLLTGIRPEVAQTLVGLGIDLSSIITCSSLQRGIALATTMEANSKNS